MKNRTFKPNHLTNLIGYVATAVGTCLMLPQIIKALETQRMADVAFGTVVLYFFNCLLWLIYGLRLGARPVIFANSIGLVVSVLQVFLKMKFG